MDTRKNRGDIISPLFSKKISKKFSFILKNYDNYECQDEWQKSYIYGF